MSRYYFVLLFSLFTAFKSHALDDDTPMRGNYDFNAWGWARLGE